MKEWGTQDSSVSRSFTRSTIAPMCMQILDVGVGGEETQPPATGFLLSQTSLYTLGTALGWQGERGWEYPSQPQCLSFIQHFGSWSSLRQCRKFIYMGFCARPILYSLGPESKGDTMAHLDGRLNVPSQRQQGKKGPRDVSQLSLGNS